ncbi:MAG: hypothetical protein R2849_06790 [Thermomicrobiales bacterium]
MTSTPTTRPSEPRKAASRRKQVVEIARQIAAAGSRLAAHNWRSASAGNLGGWQVARCLFLLNVLTGSVGTEGGTSPNAWDKFVPTPWNKPGPQSRWNEIMWPKEYPLAHHEMSFPDAAPDARRRTRPQDGRLFHPRLQPGLDESGRLLLDRMLTDENRIGMHIALTPTWNETSWYADYVLPMGLSPERHDNQSQETHPAAGSDSASGRPGFDGEDGPEGSITPGRPTPARSGKRTSSSSSFPGVSIPTAARYPEATNRHTGRARRSPSKSLPLDVREHCPRPARGKPRGRADPARIHAALWRVRGRKATYNWNEKKVFPEGAPADVRIDRTLIWRCGG